MCVCVLQKELTSQLQGSSLHGVGCFLYKQKVADWDQ